MPRVFDGDRGSVGRRNGRDRQERCSAIGTMIRFLLAQGRVIGGHSRYPTQR